MSSLIRSPKDFWPGVIFILFGLAAVLIGRDYAMGTAGRMGPAYFPTILGAILVVIGAVSVIRGMMRQGEALGSFAIKAACLVVTGSALFGLLVRNAGLPIAIIVLVMLSSLASIKFRALPYLALAVGIATFCVLVFVKALGLPMPILGPWFGV